MQRIYNRTPSTSKLHSVISYDRKQTKKTGEADEFVSEHKQQQYTVPKSRLC